MNLFQELKRRKVFKTVGVYAAASLIIIQVADIVFPRLLLPDWTVTFVIVLVIIGFAADRFSKEYIINLIRTQDREVFVNDYLNLTLNWNTGIAFGLLKGRAEFTFLLSSLVLIWLIFQFKNTFANKIEELQKDNIVLTSEKKKVKKSTKKKKN